MHRDTRTPYSVNLLFVSVQFSAFKGSKPSFLAKAIRNSRLCLISSQCTSYPVGNLVSIPSSLSLVTHISFPGKYRRASIGPTFDTVQGYPIPVNRIGSILKWEMGSHAEYSPHVSEDSLAGFANSRQPWDRIPSNSRIAIKIVSYCWYSPNISSPSLVGLFWLVLLDDIQLY